MVHPLQIYAIEGDRGGPAACGGKDFQNSLRTPKRVFSQSMIIERISPENIHHLLPLYREVFGKRITIAELTGKYDTSYLGKSWYGHLAFDESRRPIGFHGCVVFRVAWQGQTELGAQFGDAMTLKSHNGKGIFTLLGKMTEELLIKDGVSFAYGLPNQNSEFGYVNKLHWQGKDRMSGFRIRIFTFPWEKLMRLSGFEGAYQKLVARRIKNLRSADRVFPNSLIDDTHAGVLHDEAFFRYKSFTPNHVIRIGGTRVWIKARGILMVGDIDSRDEKELLAVIGGLKKLARRLGLSQIVLQYQPDTVQEAILRRHFKPFISYLAGYKSFNSRIPLEKLRLGYGDLDTF
jgi:hypothetical protein